jgi:predicted CoA-substrate-specific enzyme activase
MLPTLGIDIGSRNTKLVVYDPAQKLILAFEIQPTGVNPSQTVETMLAEVLSHNKSLSEIYMTSPTPVIPAKPVIPAQAGIHSSGLPPSPMPVIPAQAGIHFPVIYATGYGRKLFPATKVLSEVSCHAAGVQYFFPSVRTVIDIGGQDSKVISIGANGKVKDFAMNDKCAAGTGRFLEMVALRLNTTVDALAEIASHSARSLHLNSTCVVFAESEIISLIAAGTLQQDIIRAVHLSIANRILSQVNQLSWENPVVFTGGVALNSDLKARLEQVLNTVVFTPTHPEITGALGAAIIAAHENSSSNVEQDANPAKT